MSDINEIKTNVNKLFYQSFDRKIDNKTLLFWSNSIFVNERSFDDFEKSIIENSDYKLRISSKFRSLWCELIGIEVSENDLQRFISSLTNVINDNDIKQYIKNTPAYMSKIQHIINTVFNSKKDRNATEQEAEYFVNKFMMNNEYNINELENDLQLDINFNERAIDAFFKTHNTVPENVQESVRLLFTKLQDPVVLVEYITRTITNGNENVTLDEKFLHKFEEVFNRPMFVQEYTKYFASRSTISIETIFNNHIENFKRMQKLMQQYLVYNLTEKEYVQKYLFKVDDETFIDNYQNNIVFEDEYISQMKENLSSMYMRLYDDVLEQVDVDYIFERMQNDRLILSDDRIDDYLLKFKTETDEIVNRIFKVYMDVYSRTPEKQELISKSLYYRKKYNNKTYDYIDKVIEKELMLCLEFHDIIKKIIRNIKPDICTADMYKTLEHVINNLKDLNMNNIIDFIMDFVQTE